MLVYINLFIYIYIYLNIYSVLFQVITLEIFANNNNSKEYN